ncbi:hypothetical protein ACFLZC_01565 [Patescibacteria group bacterium]
MSILLKKERWEEYSKYLFGVLFSFIFIISSCYIYFMNVEVLESAERNKNVIKLNEVKREVQGMEISYLDKFEKLNVSYAELLGFIEAEPVGYIYVQKSMAQVVDYD